VNTDPDALNPHQIQRGHLAFCNIRWGLELPLSRTIRPEISFKISATWESANAEAFLSSIKLATNSGLKGFSFKAYRMYLRRISSVPKSVWKWIGPLFYQNPDSFEAYASTIFRKEKAHHQPVNCLYLFLKLLESIIKFEVIASLVKELIN
jgi:hypothetical protein